MGALKHRWLNLDSEEYIGVFAQENAYPWMAALIRVKETGGRGSKTKSQCGATLVSFTLDPQIFIPRRLEAPGWSQLLTASMMAMANRQQPSPS